MYSKISTSIFFEMSLFPLMSSIFNDLKAFSHWVIAFVKLSDSNFESSKVGADNFDL